MTKIKASTVQPIVEKLAGNPESTTNSSAAKQIAWTLNNGSADVRGDVARFLGYAQRGEEETAALPGLTMAPIAAPTDEEREALLLLADQLEKSLGLNFRAIEVKFAESMKLLGNEMEVALAEAVREVFPQDAANPAKLIGTDAGFRAEFAFQGDEGIFEMVVERDPRGPYFKGTLSLKSGEFMVDKRSLDMESRPPLKDLTKMVRESVETRLMDRLRAPSKEQEAELEAAVQQLLGPADTRS